MFGKKKERHKSGEALNIEENGTLQQSSLNPATSLREQGDIIEGRDELTPETHVDVLIALSYTFKTRLDCV